MTKKQMVFAGVVVVPFLAALIAASSMNSEADRSGVGRYASPTYTPRTGLPAATPASTAPYTQARYDDDKAYTDALLKKWVVRRSSNPNVVQVVAADWEAISPDQKQRLLQTYSDLFQWETKSRAFTLTDYQSGRQLGGYNAAGAYLTK